MSDRMRLASSVSSKTSRLIFFRLSIKWERGVFLRTSSSRLSKRVLFIFLNDGLSIKDKLFRCENFPLSNLLKIVFSIFRFTKILSLEIYNFSKGALMMARLSSFLFEAKSQLLSGVWVICSSIKFYVLKFSNGNFIIVD